MNYQTNTQTTLAPVPVSVEREVATKSNELRYALDRLHTITGLLEERLECVMSSSPISKGAATVAVVEPPLCEIANSLYQSQKSVDAAVFKIQSLLDRLEI